MFDRCNFDFIFFHSELSSYFGSQVSFLSMLLFALSVSPHCLNMCGPLILNQMTQKNHNTKVQQKSWDIFAYQTGRFISYTTAGTILAWLSLNIDQEIQHRLNVNKNLFAMILGICLCVVGVTRFFKISIFQNKKGIKNILNTYFHVQFKIFSKMQRLTSTHFKNFALGLLTVGLPCMTLSPVLLGAAATQNPISGFLILSAFFLGTLPATSFIAFFSKWIHNFTNYIPWFTGVIMILAGISVLLKVW